MFTHIRVFKYGWIFIYLHILFLLYSTNDVYTEGLYEANETIYTYECTTVSCVYIYVYTNASSASRPPTGRTIHTSPSLALMTNGSTFGELLLLLLSKLPNEGIHTNEGNKKGFSYFISN